MKFPCVLYTCMYVLPVTLSTTDMKYRCKSGFVIPASTFYSTGKCTETTVSLDISFHIYREFLTEEHFHYGIMFYPERKWPGPKVL